MENHKICPLMSNGDTLVNCSRDCKLHTHTKLDECVFQIIAKELLVIDNGVNEVQETLNTLLNDLEEAPKPLIDESVPTLEQFFTEA